jgi:DNA-binding PadR family transcriptional regulator
MLTELDNCILGVIWREGPMSAYGVRSHFARSTTVAWSSSTGTIYPAIRRLVAAGLLTAGKRTGPRKTQLLTLTDAGLVALREWLTHVTPELGSPTADPIRTRVHFLAALNPRRRAEVLAAYRAVTDDAIEQLEREAEEPARTPVEHSERLGTLGALMEVRARRAWLDQVEDELAKMDRRSGC